jgi:uncharacterized protein YlxP (DUF503 family)
MNVGILTVEIHLKDSASLKDKRRALRRLKDRLKNGFNVSVAEVDDMDKWQKAVLAIAVVSNDKKHLSGYMDSIMNFIREENRMTVFDHATEIL